MAYLRADASCTILRFLGELVLPADLPDIADDDEQRRGALRALLSAYSMLPPEALARCVAHAFKAYPCSCLHGLIQLSANAKQYSRKLRTRDIVTSEVRPTPCRLGWGGTPPQHCVARARPF